MLQRTVLAEALGMPLGMAPTASSGGPGTSSMARGGQNTKRELLQLLDGNGGVSKEGI